MTPALLLVQLSCKKKKLWLLLLPACILASAGSLDVEAMVGIWWVLAPPQKSSLKLNTQCGCRVGRKEEEELQHVGPLTVPASYIVPVK